MAETWVGLGLAGVAVVAAAVLGTALSTPRMHTPQTLIQDAVYEGVDAVLARAPQTRSELGVGRLLFECTVRPPLDETHGVLRFLSWPGPSGGRVPWLASEVPAPRPLVSIEGGRARIRARVPSVVGLDKPVLHTAELLVAGYDPVPVGLLETGAQGPGGCVPRELTLHPSDAGVSGRVTTTAGEPVPGAAVVGCGAQAITDDNGHYQMHPVDVQPCALRARAAPFSRVHSEARGLRPVRDLAVRMDFSLVVDEVPDPGVHLTRDHGVPVLSAPTVDSPWHGVIGSRPAKVLAVGGRDARELSDAELLRAVTTVAVPVRIEQVARTSGGEEVVMRRAIEARHGGVVDPGG